MRLLFTRHVGTPSELSRAKKESISEGKTLLYRENADSLKQKTKTKQSSPFSYLNSCSLLPLKLLSSKVTLRCLKTELYTPFRLLCSCCLCRPNPISTVFPFTYSFGFRRCYAVDWATENTWFVFCFVFYYFWKTLFCSARYYLTRKRAREREVSFFPVVSVSVQLKTTFWSKREVTHETSTILTSSARYRRKRDEREKESSKSWGTVGLRVCLSSWCSLLSPLVAYGVLGKLGRRKVWMVWSQV